MSYERKHNEANGEDNRDGTDDNRSQNFGVEGETTSPVVRARRLAAARALLGTLLLSTGTPMLLGGDELWRTQGGNNNAYCLDDETSWVDWSGGVEAALLTAFVARLAEIRRSSVTLHRDRFYRDGDVTWWHFSGRPMGHGDWHDHGAHSLGLLVGEWLILLHSGDAAPCTLPPGGPFTPVVDSTRDDGTPGEHPPAAGRHDDHRPDGLAAAPAPGRPAGRACHPRVGAHVSSCARTCARAFARAQPKSAEPVARGILRPCRATTSAAASAPRPSRSTGPWPPRATRRAARTGTRTRSSCSPPSPSAAGPGPAARPSAARRARRRWRLLRGRLLRLTAGHSARRSRACTGSGACAHDERAATSRRSPYTRGHHRTAAGAVDHGDARP